MEKEITILKKRYGTYRNLANALEITERYVMAIKSGKPVSKALQFRIEHLVKSKGR
jgi:hypothetical protein